MTEPLEPVSFLFTDVAGSTRLWSRDPEAMSRALAVHDDILRDAIAEHRGRVFGEAGDGFAAAFASPHQAVAAAVAGQQALADAPFGDLGPLRVRMAIHTGPAELRDGNYFGPALNLCARLLHMANAGQVVCSAAAASLLAAELPPGVTLHDLGEHTLRDFPGTERVFGVSHPGLGAQVPTLGAPTGPDNLPSPLTAFVGRGDQLERVRELVDSSPLVTLTGVGGVGKSRLALAVAGELAGRIAGGVWHVDMASTSEAAHVPEAIAKALGVLERPPYPIADTLVEHLAARPTLLLLDNCEQVVEGVAKAVERALREAEGTRILVTSRETLGVAGETVLVVPPLHTVGSPGSDPSESARLFIDRARLEDATFEPGELDVVEGICRQLEGIPLAIELAAGWVRALSLAQITEMLEDRFRLLRRRDRSATPHHQTLRATLDWSYDHLTDSEQTLLARLSVFRGGFSLDAVREVCGFEPLVADDVVHVLRRLVDQSLVSLTAGSRYGLLETVRQYAAERLGDDEGAGLRRRHAEFFLDAGPEGVSGVPARGSRLEWFAFRDLEYDNYRAALQWALQSDELDLAAALTVELGNYWLNAGCCLAEGDRWLQELLGRMDRDPSPRLQRVLTFAANHAVVSGRYEEAEDLASETFAIAETLGDPAGIASALTIKGSISQSVGRLADALASAGEALQLSLEIDDPRVPDKLLHLVWVLASMGRYDEAESKLTRHRELLDEHDDQEGRALQIMWRGILAYCRNDLDGAERCLQTALSEMPDLVRGGEAFARLHAAKVALARGRMQRAAAAGRVVRRLGRDLAEPLIEGEALVVEAEADVELGNREQAADLLDAATRLLGTANARRLGSKIAAARGAVKATDDDAEAAAWLGTSQALISAMGAQRPLPEQQRFDGLVARLREELGAPEFSVQWARAVRLDADAALAKARLRSTSRWG